MVLIPGSEVSSARVTSPPTYSQSIRVSPPQVLDLPIRDPVVAVASATSAASVASSATSTGGAYSAVRNFGNRPEKQ